jgi:uncharacterized protein YcfL
MKKGILCLMVLVVLASLAFSGCQDSKSTTTKLSSQNVYLQSTVVKFANVSLEKTMNKSGMIDSVKVSWLFQNIAGKTINVAIDVRFYDNKNTLLYNETRWLRDIPKGYTERSMSPTANSVTFMNPRANLVDHVVISVTEM